MKPVHLLIFLFLAVLSCKNKKKETLKNDTCQIDKEYVLDVLKFNRHSDYKTFVIENFEERIKCSDLDSTILLLLKDYSIRNKADRKFMDTLNHVIDFENFETLAKKEENKFDEIIRLTRSNFSYGLNEIIVVEGHQKRKSINIKKYKLSFNDKCNGSLFTFKNGIPFSSKCFNIEGMNKTKITQDAWNSLREIMLRTEFKNTYYKNFSGGITLCHSDSYLIEYSSGSQIEKKIKKLERACPGDLTSIYQVGEKLIELASIK